MWKGLKHSHHSIHWEIVKRIYVAKVDCWDFSICETFCYLGYRTNKTPKYLKMPSNIIRVMQNLNIKNSGSHCTEYFNRVIGFVEDIVVSEEFQNMQTSFLDKYYQEFDDDEENKVVYMEIFKEYTTLMEMCIVNNLNLRVNGAFQMDKFAEELQYMKPELDGEIFELLFSLTDFLTFKDLMLDYKASKNGHFEDIINGIIVTPMERQ